MDTVEMGAGKTHRMLQQALAGASLGKSVVVLGSTMLHVQNLRDHANKICFEAGVDATASGTKLKLAGGGTVTFLRTQPTLSPGELMELVGHDPDRTYVDHFAQETALAHLKRLHDEWENLNDGSS